MEPKLHSTLEFFLFEWHCPCGCLPSFLDPTTKCVGERGNLACPAASHAPSLKKPPRVRPAPPLLSTALRRRFVHSRGDPLRSPCWDLSPPRLTPTALIIPFDHS